MALIVEMIHGCLNGFQVNRHGNLTKSNDYAFFSCGYSKWKRVLVIGEQFGWRPMGSVINNTLSTNNAVKSDYSPSSWNENEVYKVFLSEDALALSDALQAFFDYDNKTIEDLKVRGATIITEDMNEEQYQLVNGDIEVSFLEDFISFLRKGDFIFVWDD